MKKKLQSNEEQQRTTEGIERMVKFLARGKGYGNDDVPEQIRDITERMGKLIGEDWITLGMELKLKDDTLRKIKESQASPERKFEMLIADWTREKEEWDVYTLLKALKTIGRDPLKDRPLSVCEMDVFDSSRRFLLENLTGPCVTRICDELFSQRIFSLETKSAILKLQYLGDKIAKLLQCLKHCPEGTLNIFYEILRKCELGFIADTLTGIPTQVLGGDQSTPVHAPVHAPVQETVGPSSQDQFPVHGIHWVNTKEPTARDASPDNLPISNQAVEDQQKVQNCNPDEISLDYETTMHLKYQEISQCEEQITGQQEPNIEMLTKIEIGHSAQGKYTEYWEQTGVLFQMEGELKTDRTDMKRPNEAVLSQTENEESHPPIRTDEDVSASWEQTGDPSPTAEQLASLKQGIQTCSHSMTASELLECEFFLKLLFWFVKMVQICISQNTESVLHISRLDLSKFQPDMQLELKSVIVLLLTHVGVDVMTSLENAIEVQFNILVNNLIFMCDNDDIPEDKSSQWKEHLLLLNNLLHRVEHKSDYAQDRVYWIFRKPKGELVHT